jgi:soluble lytic murein transglycosylase
LRRRCDLGGPQKQENDRRRHFAFNCDRKPMIRYLISILLILVVILIAGSFFFLRFWEHRYDEVISRQARIFNIDASLVWSIVYEETYFRTTSLGADGEIGLMQVTAPVAREWAKETGLSTFERQVNEDLTRFLQNPERNVQIGCWYYQRVRSTYRSLPAETAMSLAAYNAGPSRVEEWTAGSDTSALSEADFIARIGIESTRAYVTSILKRYRSTTLEIK